MEPSPALLFYRVIAQAVFKTRNKNVPGQASPCQEPESCWDLRAWQGSLQFMCIGPGVTLGKLKFVGHNCQESIPEKGTSSDIHLDVAQEVGSTQLTSSWMGKEVLRRKMCLPALWRDGEKEINSVSERVGKHPPPSPLRQDSLGKGK